MLNMSYLSFSHIQLDTQSHCPPRKSIPVVSDTSIPNYVESSD